MIVTGTLIANADPHQKFSTSQPPSTSPSAPPPPAMPAQMPMALARSLRREAVDEDAERCRHHQCAADSHDSTGGDDLSRRIGEEGGVGRGGTEQDDARLHEPLAPEAVAQSAGGEEHAGEDQRVGVDDPLLLAVGEAERLRHRAAARR